MIKLIIPKEEYLDSYKEAYYEYKNNNVDTYEFSNPNEIDIFEKFNNYRNEINLKPGRVGADYYWLVDEGNKQFIGEISIRHNLTEELKKYGGHIGYGVRYSMWNKGYGSLMLNLALEKAKERNLNKVLITCDDDNIASARVMEHNGAILEDKIKNIIDNKSIITRRYWINI